MKKIKEIKNQFGKVDIQSRNIVQTWDIIITFDKILKNMSDWTEHFTKYQFKGKPTPFYQIFQKTLQIKFEAYLRAIS